MWIWTLREKENVQLLKHQPDRYDRGHHATESHRQGE